MANNRLKLHKAQMLVYSSRSRFKCVVAGRRFGKTILSRTLLIKYATKAGSKVWYVAPTYRMAKQIMWQDLQDSLPKRWIRRVNETTLTIWLINGSMIELKGADNPDSLRGVGLDFVVLDEFQDISEETWVKVLRPTLADRMGHALFIGSPKGYNYFHTIYLLGQDQRRVARNEWQSWQFPTIASPFIPQSEIEAARADMDDKSFNQEFLASFQNMSGKVYYPFDRKEHVKRCLFNPNLPIWVGQDFNIDPMSAVLMQPQLDGTVWIVDEIIRFSSNTEDSVDELERRYHRHLPKVVIYPDPAGGYRQHARGETDLDIFREKGFKRIKHRKKHPAISDRINCVNRMLKDANGMIRLFIDDGCKNTIASLDQTTYKKGTREIDKAMSVEHCFHGEQKVNVNGVLMPFKSIPKSGVVLCHDGKYRDYINGGKIKGLSPMLLVTLSNGAKIRCTDDHKFLTTDGWLKASKIKGKTLCNQKLLAKLSKNMMEKDGICAKADTFKETAKGCTEQFGLNILGKFLRSTIFIISTTTNTTTLLKIFNVSRLHGTCRIIASDMVGECHQKLGLRQLSGTVAKKVSSGIKNITKPLKTHYTKKTKIIFAHSVAQILLAQGLKKLPFVQKNAKQRKEENLASITKRELALFVVKSLKLTSIQKQKHALGLAPLVTHIEQDEPSDAYCMTVPGFGMFEVEGVIVSNCTDALGYCLELEFPIRKIDIAGVSI